MSNIDKNALREAAENATPGPWNIARNGKTITSNQSHPVAVITEDFHRMLANGKTGCDAEFIAAANPATVLALLDELEDYKAAYEEEYRDKEVQRSVIDGALCKLLPGCQYMDPPDGGSVTPLEQVSRMIADYSEQLQAAEKRIAELEIARDKCFLSGLKTGWGYGIADDAEGYNREISDAQAVIDRAAGTAKGE